MRNLTGFFLSISICVFQLHAKPSGFKAHHGNVRITHAKKHHTKITSNGKAVIHWDKFSIAKGEKITFDQSGKNAAVLNRVNGKFPSHIYGKLKSNGKVYLVNKHGVVIGPNAKIVSSGFLASTSNISTDQFLRGEKLEFSNFSKNQIVNLGTIEAPTGDVTLLAQTVENHGKISAPEGHVALASGREIILESDGIFIKPGLSENNTVINAGEISALSVELKTQGVFAQAVRSSGIIQANRIEECGGKILLKAEGGETRVSGKLESFGGTIHVLGKEVFVTDHALIDVSHPTHPGEVLIGGDNRGANPKILNAQMVFAGKHTQVLANATDNGDGGKIIFWADDSTAMYGQAHVRGGDFGGGGDFVLPDFLIGVRRRENAGNCF